jgi:hypothetical protein
MPNLKLNIWCSLIQSESLRLLCLTYFHQDWAPLVREMDQIGHYCWKNYLST